MAQTSKAIRTALSAAVGLGLVACSGSSNQVAPLTIDTTVAVASTVTTGPSTTVVPTTVEATVVPTTEPTTTADGLTGPMFSDALGVKVDTAPGVNTRGDTRQLLPEGLYVHLAWEQDPNDLSVFSPRPEDIPILEAYAYAVTTYYRAATGVLTTDDPDFATYMLDAGALFDEAFAQARSSNLVLSLGSGVVLRPYVLSQETTTTTATVLDCYLEDQRYLKRGAVATPGPLKSTGQIVTLTLVDGLWKVDLAGTEPEACL